MNISETYGNINSQTNDEHAFASLCSILGNRVSIGIIKSSIKEPASVARISREHHIPISSVYRQIRRLQKADIIEVEFKAPNHKNNKKITYYRCTLRSVKLEIDKRGTLTWLQRSAE